MFGLFPFFLKTVVSVVCPPLVPQTDVWSVPFLSKDCGISGVSATGTTA